MKIILSLAIMVLFFSNLAQAKTPSIQIGAENTGIPVQISLSGRFEKESIIATQLSNWTTSPRYRSSLTYELPENKLLHIKYISCRTRLVDGGGDIRIELSKRGQSDFESNIIGNMIPVAVFREGFNNSTEIRTSSMLVDTYLGLTNPDGSFTGDSIHLHSIKNYRESGGTIQCMISGVLYDL